MELICELPASPYELCPEDAVTGGLQGESAAVLNTVDALAGCLERPGGCAVVPGLPTDQYKLTLGTSILGGLVAGYASRLQPDGTQLQAACMLT